MNPQCEHVVTQLPKNRKNVVVSPPIAQAPPKHDSTFCWSDHFPNSERLGWTHCFSPCVRFNTRLIQRAFPTLWQVLHLETTKKKVQLTDKFSDGISLAMKDGSGELTVGTPSGCLVCRTVTRRLRDDAADLIFTTVFVEHPGISCQNDEIIREPRGPDVRTAFTDLPPPDSTEPSTPRLVYIGNSGELDRYGNTSNCLGCEAAMTASPGLSRHHSERTARIVKAMLADVAPSVACECRPENGENHWATN